MDKIALDYNVQGLRLVNLGKYSDAIDFFSKAIDIDPDFADAYQNRGEAYILLDRFVKGNRDIYKAKELKSGRAKTRQVNKEPHVKVNMQEVDSVYDTLFSDNPDGDDDSTLAFDDNLFDFVFSDENIEDDKTWEEIVRKPSASDSYPAILEYIGGERQEVAGAVLFSPNMDTVTIVNEQDAADLEVPFEKLSCIRVSGVPSQLKEKQDPVGCIEIIETVDGNIYHELVHPDQDIEGLLFGFSTKENTRFRYSFIPKKNIETRRQQRLLGDILLEKRLIGNDILKNALNEYHHTKSLKLGKIIAKQAHILYSDIEKELDKSTSVKTMGLRVGEILLASGLVKEEQVLNALEYQEHLRNLKMGQFLVEKGIVQEKEVYVSLAEKHRLQFIDLRKQKISKKVLSSLPRSLILENEIIPVAKKNGRIVVATHYVDTTHLCEQILIASKCQEVQYVLAQPTHIRNIINLLYKRKESS